MSRECHAAVIASMANSKQEVLSIAKRTYYATICVDNTMMAWAGFLSARGSFSARSGIGGQGNRRFGGIMK